MKERMEISAKGDGPMIFEANQVIDGQVQNRDEIEDNFATALILIIMWYLVASTIAFLSALLCKGVKTALNGRLFFVRNPSNSLQRKCGNRQFWPFENEFQHFENEFQLFENQFHYF